MSKPDARPPQTTLGRLLVVDHDADSLAEICARLQQHGYDAVGHANAEDALNALRSQPFDVLLADLQTPTSDGINLMAAARAIEPHLIAIVFSDHASIQAAVTANRLSAFETIEKPFDVQELLPTLAHAMAIRRLRRENRQLRETLGVYELSVAIGFTLEIDTLLNKLMGAAWQQCEADEVSILLPTPEGDELYVAAARGGHREKILGLRVAMAEGIAGWVARNNEPVILTGEVTDARFTPAHPRPDIRCAISVPMMVGGQCVGVLNVNATNAHRPFTHGQVKALTILTGTVAPALKAAALHAQVQAAMEEWEQCFDAVTDKVCIVNRAGEIVRANKAMGARFEPAHGNLIGLDCRDIYCGGATADDQSPFSTVLQTGVPVVVENLLSALGGWYLISCYPLFDRTGTQWGAVCAVRDITNRKRNEAAIASYNERLRILHEIDRALIAGEEPAAIAKAVLPLLRDLIRVNRVVVNLFDLATGEVEWLAAVGRKRVHVGPGVRYPIRFMGDVEALRRGEHQVVDVNTLPAGPEVDALRRSGVHSYHVLPMSARGELIGAVSFGGGAPITEEKIGIAQEVAAQFAIALMQARLHERIRRQALELEDRNQTLTTLINASPLAIIVVDADNRVKVWSHAAEQIFGWPAADVLGKAAPTVPPEKQGELKALSAKERAGKATTGLETVRRRRDGALINVVVSTAPLFNASGDFIGAVRVVGDITARKNLEEQFHQAQKMEAFGQLAGGVAHDFNNLLTIITGYSELILSGMVQGEKEKALVREIRKAGDRAAGLTRQLLAFSRKQMLQPVELNLNALVGEMEKMLRRLIGEDIDLATALDPDLAHVKTDPGQMEQVIMNLVVNARDAMPTGGHLTIETHNVVLDQTYADKHAGVRPGKYVMLAVADSGSGMNDEVKSKIFEPFFTTKEIGKGTGLGLATVHGIVKQSGGAIEVYSEVGKGATFKVYFPRAGEKASTGKSTPGLTLLPKGTETILLAEDEEAVRGTIRLVLESQGYTVLCAASGEEALKMCDKHPGRIHLLMTDVVMPKLSGRQLADRVAATHPHIKVLYLSGYTDDAIVRHGVLEAGMAFLQKPFTPLNLAQKVREVLDK